SSPPGEHCDAHGGLLRLALIDRALHRPRLAAVEGLGDATRTLSPVSCERLWSVQDLTSDRNPVARPVARSGGTPPEEAVRHTAVSSDLLQVEAVLEILRPIPELQARPQRDRRDRHVQ